MRQRSSALNTLTRKVVLATVGSLGDLHPFIALAAALRDRGLNVHLACAAEYQAKVEAAGLAFHPLRPGFDDIQHDLGMDRAELTRRVVADSEFLFRRLVLPYVRTAYEDMMRITADADLILSSSLAFGARLAGEKRGIPWIAVVLQPMMFLSSYDPPVILEAERLSALLRALGPTPARYVLWILKKAVNRVFRPLHALRAELGLKRTPQNPCSRGNSPVPARSDCIRDCWERCSRTIRSRRRSWDSPRSTAKMAEAALGIPRWKSF